MRLRDLAIGGLIVAVVTLVGLAYRKGRPPAPPTATTSSHTLTDEEKARIQEFWSAYRRARALKLTGRWEAALAEYRRALELDPRHEDSLYNMANCHFELNQFEKALELLERLVEVNPMSHRGHYQMGVIHACPLAGRQFDLETAERALLRAFEINQEESGALLRLGEVALVKGNDERAFELFSLANRSNFRAVEGYYLRAYLRWKQERLEESRRLLLEALRQQRKPAVVAGVPGEGDRRAGSLLPPTTLDEKLPLKRFWVNLTDRYAEDHLEVEALAAEFAPLEACLHDLRARLERGGR